MRKAALRIFDCAISSFLLILHPFGVPDLPDRASLAGAKLAEGARVIFGRLQALTCQSGSFPSCEFNAVLAATVKPHLIYND
jgi:hypothetical protein